MGHSHHTVPNILRNSKVRYRAYNSSATYCYQQNNKVHTQPTYLHIF